MIRKENLALGWTVIGHMKKKGKSIFHVRDEKTKKDLMSNIEQKQIKKVIGIFGGRFQPFHSGHLAYINGYQNKLTKVYNHIKHQTITKTSNGL